VLVEQYGPRERAKRRNFDLSRLGFHDNDLWIASCALDVAMTVVSTDGGFARIAAVSDLEVDSWI